MRIPNRDTIYLSDLLAVPMPVYAPTRRAFRRRLRLRRLLWALVPRAAGALGLLALLLLLTVGMGFGAGLLG